MAEALETVHDQSPLRSFDVTADAGLIATYGDKTTSVTCTITVETSGNTESKIEQ